MENKTHNRLQKLFLGMSIAGCVGVATLGGVSIWTQGKLSEALETKANISTALYNHMTSDMMHDAIRGDVLAALKASLAGETSEATQAAADLEEHIATFRSNIEQNNALVLPDEIKTALGKLDAPLDEYANQATSITRDAGRSYDKASGEFSDFSAAFSHLEDGMEKVSEELEAWGAEQSAQTDALVTQTHYIQSGLTLMVLLLVFSSPIIIFRRVFRPLHNTTQSMMTISEGNNADVIGTERQDEIGDIARALGELKDTMNTATRMQLALDNMTSNVMIADENFNIIYMNESVANMLRAAEADLQKELPRFRVDSIIGSNIDIFHKNPAHQRGMLDKLSDTYKTSILVGGHSFNLVANPIFGKGGSRLGTAVEWLDGAAAGVMDAIDRSQAAIEFRLDGTIITANKNFLETMGYTLEEIRGKHHSLFVDPALVGSAEYKRFWENLGHGEFQAGEFKRIGKGNKEVWIQASYNPIIDMKGKVVKVVKYATNITEMVITRTENERGMNEAVKVLNEVAGGSLMQRMEGEYFGTFNDIKRALNATIDKLIEVVAGIKEATESVNSAASEIASGSQDLSARTENQASSLEETAASMEEITGTVQSNAENAKQADNLSSDARGVAEKGGDVVSTAIDAMGRIETSSQKISDIIGVIDEIAFQTNLLALNAAVEAARAGEAGKGFAVVASEVRSLAGRSASASKEIKALIQESVEQVKNGSELVNQTGSTLEEIVTSVSKVADIITAIAEASREQSSGISEINTAIAQMDEMTQQNAALVQETTAAAQSLAQKGIELNRLISFFRVDDSVGMGHSNTLEFKSAPAASNTYSGGAKATAPKKVPAGVLKQAANGHANGAASSGDGWEEF